MPTIRPSLRPALALAAMVFLFGAAGEARAAEPPDTPAGRALAGQIQQLLKAGKVDEALSVAAASRQQLPADAAVRWHFVQLHLSVSRQLIRSLQYARAEELLKTVLAAVPDEPAAARMLLAIRDARARVPARIADAKKMLQIELYEQALQIYEQAAALVPKEAGAWQRDWVECLRGIGDDYYRSGLYAVAFPWYQRAVDAGEGRDTALLRRWMHCMIFFAAEAADEAKLSKDAWMLLLEKATPILATLGDQILGDVVRGLVTQNVGQFADAAESYASATGKQVDPAAYTTSASLNPLRAAALEVIRGQVEDLGAASLPARWKAALPGDWLKRDSDRFVIYHHNDYVALRVQEAVEFHLPRIVAAWGGRLETLDWPKKLRIELWPDREKMQAAIKQPSITGGANLIRYRAGSLELVDQTIYCVQTDPKLLDAVLAHELTHVVISALTARVPMPLAISEGMAILSEPPYRWAYYQKQFRGARDAGGLFPLRQLLAFTQQQFPPLDRALVYYAESHAFVRFLLEQGGRAKLLDAARRFERQDPAEVLAATYGWKGFGDMDAAWLAFVRAY